jgi:hypothetical protein
MDIKMYTTDHNGIRFEDTMCQHDQWRVEGSTIKFSFAVALLGSRSSAATHKKAAINSHKLN